MHAPSSNSIIAPNNRSNFRVSCGPGNTPGHPLFNASAVSEFKPDPLKIHSLSIEPPPNIHKRESILRNKNNLKLDIAYSDCRIFSNRQSTGGYYLNKNPQTSNPKSRRSNLNLPQRRPPTSSSATPPNPSKRGSLSQGQGFANTVNDEFWKFDNKATLIMEDFIGSRDKDGYFDFFGIDDIEKHIKLTLKEKLRLKTIVGYIEGFISKGRRA